MHAPRRSLVTVLLAALAVVAACGEKSAPPKGPSAGVAGPAPAPRPEGDLASLDARTFRRAGGPRDAVPGLPSSPAGEPAPVGSLERRDRLDHFFAGLSRLDAGDREDDVRVVQFGDSHTAADFATAVVRRELQARFGDGGRGFVSIGKPWKTYEQDGIRGGMTAGFEPLKVRFQKGQFEGVGGEYGLLGVGIGATRAGERAWTEVAARASRVELDYGRGPAGGSFELFVDGGAVGRVSTRAATAGSGFYAVDVPDAPHQIELRALGDGEVRVYGMALDRAQAGVVLDALGINGAETFTALRWSEAHFAEQLRHRAPALVVLAYGTNESLDPALTDADYARSIVDLLGRVSRAAPGADCLLLGPTDRAVRAGAPDSWASAPRLAEIVEVERRVSRAAGCAFYDQLAAMGGPGSMVAWAAEAEPRAAKDHVHFTRGGYTVLGEGFAADLLHAYDEWRAERGLTPTSGRRTWGMARR